MTSVHISVPSKTFLVGEYIVLTGGPGIILATKQRFKLIASSTKHHNSNVQGISPKSPAGKLIKHNIEFYKKYRIQFVDPYQGLGGLGASSAQFVMIFALQKYIMQQKLDNDDVLSHYLKYAWDGSGIAPSGVDVLSQIHGKLCFSYKEKKELQTYGWTFSDLAYCLIHTGNKVRTHIHLKEFESFDDSDLKDIVQKCLVSIKKGDDLLFIESIMDYSKALEAKNLVTEHTRNLLGKLLQIPEILAAKGCGALGADIVLLIFKRRSQEQVISYLKKKELNVIVYSDEVENGLEIGTM